MKALLSNELKKSRKFAIKLSQREFGHVSDLAQAYRISRAELIRRLFLGANMPTPNADLLVYRDFARALFKTNADIARLGNLFKLAIEALDDHKKAEPLVQISRDIAIHHTQLKELVQNITALKIVK